MYKTGWKQNPLKDSFVYSITELLSNSNEILNSISRSEENHASFGNFLEILWSYWTNFKSKGLVLEWKLAARSFENIILCRGSTNSPIDIHKSSIELSHLFGTTSLDLCLTRNHNFYWKWRKMQTNQNMVAYYLKRKCDFNSKHSKWIFKIDFQRDLMRKSIFTLK